MKLLHATCTPAEANIGPQPDEFAVIAAAGVIHDLGNLIQIASSAINIVARTPHMPGLHAGPMLDRAKSCLEHAGALVHQNIAVVRDRMIEDEHTSVAKCLSDVAALAEGLGEPSLTLDVKVEPNLPKVGCDAIGLSRAILNLVFNARDAIRGRGRIRVEARAIWHGLVASGVAISVADEGVGMTPATIARVFDPFFTTKTNGLGGLGLSMVARFVRDAGGEVAVESEPGIGTIVTVRLPAMVEAAGADFAMHAEAKPEEADR